MTTFETGDRVRFTPPGFRRDERTGEVFEVVTTELYGTDVYVRDDDGQKYQLSAGAVEKVEIATDGGRDVFEDGTATACPDCGGDLQYQNRVAVLCLECESEFEHFHSTTEHKFYTVADDEADLEIVATAPLEGHDVATDGGRDTYTTQFEFSTITKSWFPQLQEYRLLGLISPSSFIRPTQTDSQRVHLMRIGSLPFIPLSEHLIGIAVNSIGIFQYLKQIYSRCDISIGCSPNDLPIFRCGMRDGIQVVAGGDDR